MRRPIKRLEWASPVSGLWVLSVVTVGGPEYAGTIERADDEYVVRDGRSTRIGSFADLESAKRTLGDTA